VALVAAGEGATKPALYAQVLYVKDGKGDGLCLRAVGSGALPHDLSDRIRNDIVSKVGVDWRLVVLNASHTHKIGREPS
jgi:hypothetical protein